MSGRGLGELIADGRTWPLAFDLYLPASWTDDAARRVIPSTVRFRKKWRIALAQVRPGTAHVELNGILNMRAREPRATLYVTPLP